MSSSSSKGYQFTIQNGIVKAVYEYDHGVLERDDIDHNETWSVSGSQVVKTEQDNGRMETTVFSDVDGDGIFNKINDDAPDTHVGDDRDTYNELPDRTENNTMTIASNTGNHQETMHRLYKSAFDRTPDVPGLNNWTRAIDNGMTLEQVASKFIASEEFISLYGLAPSNGEFVNLLYQNVLNRSPDMEGYVSWTNALSNGLSRETVLVGFSESAENQAAIIGTNYEGVEFI